MVSGVEGGDGLGTTDGEVFERASDVPKTVEFLRKIIENGQCELWTFELRDLVLERRRIAGHDVENEEWWGMRGKEDVLYSARAASAQESKPREEVKEALHKYAMAIDHEGLEADDKKSRENADLDALILEVHLLISLGANISHIPVHQMFLVFGINDDGDLIE